MQLEQGPGLDSIAHRGLTWIAVHNPTRKELETLAHERTFHPLNLDDCLSKIQLTKVDDHQAYLFLVLHFPTQQPNHLVTSSQLSVFLGKDYLVTIHRGGFKALSEMFQTCKRDEQQRNTFMGRSAGYLLYRIIDRLIDELFPLLDKVMADMDDMEEGVFDEAASNVREINRLRREIGALRRIIFPLRRLVGDLAPKVQRFSEHELSPYLSDIKDHVEKVWETLDEAKETIEIYKDTDFIMSTEKTNQILAVLTVIFTLTIPIVTVATLYGTNINLPCGIATGPCTFLGPYTALILLVAPSVALSAVMGWYFRRLGWF
jgi:magnesium transporter